jgi:hypothetical protein
MMRNVVAVVVVVKKGKRKGAKERINKIINIFLVLA